MKVGKISESVLKRSVLKTIKGRKGVHIDSAFIEIPEGHVLVTSTDPITCATEDIAEYAVHAAINDIVVTGANPIGILVTILMPCYFMESDLKQMMMQFKQICEELDICILGGHTETTTAVIRPIVSITAVGSILKNKFLDANNIKVGQDIVMSKGIGIEGTAILAKDRREVLKERFSSVFLRQCEQFIKYISIIDECKVATQCGVTAMHDVSEGGIYGALWELASGLNLGLEVDLKSILIRQETIELCEMFDINPYTMLSGGTVLMIVDDGEKLVNDLNEHEIQATVIGKITTGNDRVVINGDERRFLEPPRNSVELNIVEKR